MLASSRIRYDKFYRYQIYFIYELTYTVHYHTSFLSKYSYRSGSDPSLALSCEDGAVDINPGYYSSTKKQDENRKPSTQSTGSGKNRSLVGKSPGASPKTSKIASIHSSI